MQIFLSYASEDRDLADQIHLALVGGGHKVFFDQESLPYGGDYQTRIRSAVERSDIFIFLISPESVTHGSFALTELKYARTKWPHPTGRVLPVIVRRVPWDTIPAYLKAITVLDPGGNVPAEVFIAVSEMTPLVRPPQDRTVEAAWRKTAAVSVLLIAGGFGIWALWSKGDTSNPEPIPVTTARPKGDTRKPEPIPVPAAQPKGDTSESDLIPVPDVRRLSLDAARSRLTEAQLRIGRMTFYTLGRYEPGTIYNQETAPGSRVRRGTAIGLYVEREKLPGIQSSGQKYLSPTEVWDLDGERDSGKQDYDIRFDAASATERYLEPQNGAVIGVVGRTPVNRDQCAGASLSNSRILVEIGAYLCVRTNRGRYSLLRIDDLSRELQLSFDTWQSTSTSSGPAQESAIRQVQLGNQDSYHFLKGVRSKLQGGDFYLHIAENGAAQFFANNRDQRGLVNLGDIGRVPLNEVPVPKSGYYKFGVPVVAGHTYVSLARTGEEEHFVVLRVDRVTNDSVTLSYVYR